MNDAVTDITARIGRSLECIRSHLLLEHNTFQASLEATIKNHGVEAIWKDADTIDESHDNTILYGL